MTTEGRRFPAEPASVGEARRFVAERLQEHGVDRWPADLLVSELATNVITHAATEFEVIVHVDGKVKVTVVDDSIIEPQPRSASPTDVGGRGLHIVDYLAARWGIEWRPEGTGKAIWFELPSAD
jgi:anti-sigma regulatory factor (Ser/Thr protein kinase)